MSPVLRLWLLGQVHITDGCGRPVNPRLLQPRKLALLAILAVEARPVSRQEIAALMWPEVPESRARASLSQLLHEIRRDCASDPFLVEGANVTLKRSVVACDVLDFHDAARSVRVDPWFRNTPTSFMPGFAFQGSNHMEEWVSAQRRSFELALAELAWRAAEHSEDPAAELVCLNFAESLRPLDEAILRRRMRVLAQTGQCGAAIAAYETFRQAALDELGVSPSSATRDLASEILAATPAGSAVASLRKNDADPRSTPIVVEDGSATRLTLLSRAAALLVLGLATVLGVVLSPALKGDAAVLPVVSLGGLQIRTVADSGVSGLLDDLAALLSEDPTFSVELGVDSTANVALSGTVSVETNRVEGTILLQSPRGRVTSAIPVSYDRATEAAVAHDLSRRLRTAIHAAVASDAASRSRAALDQQVAAAAAHARNGAYALAEDMLRELEATVAAARLSEYDRSEVSSSIWERRGWNSLAQGDRSAATEHFERAIEMLRPSTTGGAPESVYSRLADLHYYAWTADTGDSRHHLEQAIALLDRAPPALLASSALLRRAAVLYGLGRYHEAYSAADVARSRSRTQALRPDLTVLLFQSAFNAGLDHIAASECRRVREYMPSAWPSIGCAAMLAGWSGVDSYDLAELATSIHQLQEPEPVRAAMQAKMQLLVAAAAARRGDLRHARDLTRDVPVQDEDAGHLVFLAAFHHAIGDQDSADALLRDLASRPDGRRTSRSYARLLRPGGR